MPSVVDSYLDLLDSQRETAFAALHGLDDAQLWQRPAPKEWCLGEMLDHNYLLIASFLPLARFSWNALHGWARKRRQRPYATQIEDVYRKESFPMWVGFLWTPRHNPRKPVPLAQLKQEMEALHHEVRAFYTGKDEDLLGNIYLYDPVFGWINLIVTLRIGIYHDQLHFDDIIKRAKDLKR
jgi:hypothetical protein